MSDDRKDLPAVSSDNFLQRVREALQTYMGSQRSISLRSAAIPAASTFAHCAAVRRIDRCSSFSPGNFKGLPICFFGGSIRQLSVMQKGWRNILFCDSIVAMNPTEKPCTKCGKTLPFYSFRKKANAADGLRSQCAACDRAYRAANRERDAAMSAKRRAEAPEKYAAMSARWQKQNPQKANERQRRYAKANPKKLALRRAEKRKERAEYNAQWRALNPELCRTYCRNRRARKLSVGGTHTPDDIKTLLALQKCKCAACKACIKDAYHADHITPLSKGGSNDKQNIQLLCPSCNLKKGVSDPLDFMQSRGYLI